MVANGKFPTLAADRLRLCMARNLWIVTALMGLLTPACLAAKSDTIAGALSLDGGAVVWMWSGAVTPQGFQVNARLAIDAAAVRLAVDTSSDFPAPLYSAPESAGEENDRIVALPVDGLKPGTSYVYALEIDGVLHDDVTGTARTFQEGAFSFRFAFGGDAITGSDAPVFDAVRAEDALFFLHPGDMTYADIVENDRQLYLDAYGQALTAPRQAALYRSLPIAYMWDDHDYSDNNSNRTAPSRPAARAVYQQIVPHYPLPDSTLEPACTDSPESACRSVNQTFAVGRVYFIMTDLRSARTGWIRAPVRYQHDG